MLFRSDEGNDVAMQLTQEAQHFSSDDVGRMFCFQSMPTNNGHHDGLRVNRFTDKNGNERVSLQVGKIAHFYEIEESAEPEVKTADKVSPPAVKFEPSVSSLVALHVQIESEFELQTGQKPSDAKVATVFIQACMNNLHRKPLLDGGLLFRREGVSRKQVCGYRREVPLAAVDVVLRQERGHTLVSLDGASVVKIGRAHV